MAARRNSHYKVSMESWTTNITSFPWTTNEKEVYICFIDEKLKF